MNILLATRSMKLFDANLITNGMDGQGYVYKQTNKRENTNDIKIKNDISVLLNIEIFVSSSRTLPVAL